MRTKIVDIHCKIDGCQLVTSTVIAVGLPCDPILMFTHSPRGEHAPFSGPPCRGSGLRIALIDPDTIRAVRVLGPLTKVELVEAAVLEVDRDPPVAKAARRKRDETHHDDDDDERDVEDEIAHPRE